VVIDNARLYGNDMSIDGNGLRFLNLAIRAQAYVNKPVNRARIRNDRRSRAKMTLGREISVKFTCTGTYRLLTCYLSVDRFRWDTDFEVVGMDRRPGLQGQQSKEASPESRKETRDWCKECSCISHRLVIDG
jgi:hypothetical protein